MTATYGYDFADRQETLDVQVGANPVQPLVTASSYLPGGPLTSLALGNGATETREYDGRYAPEAIVLGAPVPRRWSYTTDGVGNILEIEGLIGCSEADLVLSNQSVTGIETFTTCAGIEAGPAFSVETGGSATFTAGTQIALGDRFSVQSGASFVAGIDPAQSPEVETRSYGYQDFQYFLTRGDGPWGSLAWTYDLIGNRLTETRDGVTDTYSYVANGGEGNTAILSQITLGLVGTRDYQFGAAGHLETVTAGANQVVFDSDDEGRLAELSRPVASASVDILYDGRSFMQSTVDPATGAVTEPTYSSEGLLHALRRQETPISPEQRFTYLYFAGRPVAQLELDGSGGQTLLYLITDHLGTPVVALGETGEEIWDSAFEPFGRDAEEATPDGALAKEVFLRFPGQWEDGRWAGAAMGAEVLYNVHRWYQPGLGTYNRTDPLGVNNLRDHVYAYAQGSPLLSVDTLGLAAKLCCRLLNSYVAGTILGKRHCYVVADDGTVYGLYPEGVSGRTLGVPRTYDPRDVGGTCRECPCDNNGTQNQCLQQQFQSYPIGTYKTLGPNSNTFAGTLAGACCKGGIPQGFDDAPGLTDNPPQDTGFRPVPTKPRP